MRSFGSIALRQVRARRMRALLTAAGIVLGVGMIFGVLTLSGTISRTFTDLFDSVYGKADLVVSGTESTSLPRKALRQVRATPGVDEAQGSVFSVFTKYVKPPPPPEPPPVPEGLPPGTPPPGGPRLPSPPKPDPSDQLNVVGEEPGVTDLTDTDLTSGRRPREGLEIIVQESWAEDHEIAAGDRLRLVTPAGTRGFDVTGLFQFSTGVDFGGQGFATMPVRRAREVMDKGRGYDEIDVVVEGGDEAIAAVRRDLRGELEKGARIATPDAKSDDVESQLQAFNAILYFFAAMALFVGGFLIFNAFNMTVLQRTRELGMLRTLGATRPMVVRAVLREALALGLVGCVLGLGLGIVLAIGLVKLMRDGLDFPVGDVAFSAAPAAAAVFCGLLTAFFGALLPARRAGKTSPIRAVLGTEGLRSRPRARRAVAGLVLIGVGLGGAFWLGAADETTLARRRRRDERHDRDLLRDRDDRAVRDRPDGPGARLAAAPRLAGRRAPRRRLGAVGSGAHRGDRDGPHDRARARGRREQPRRQLPRLDPVRVRPRLRPRPLGPAAPASRPARDRSRRSRRRSATGSRSCPRPGCSRASASSSRRTCRRRRESAGRTGSCSVSSCRSTPSSTRPRSTGEGRPARRSSTGSPTARSRSARAMPTRPASGSATGSSSKALRAASAPAWRGSSRR